MDEVERRSRRRSVAHSAEPTPSHRADPLVAGVRSSIRAGDERSNGGRQLRLLRPSEVADLLDARDLGNVKRPPDDLVANVSPERVDGQRPVKRDRRVADLGKFRTRLSSLEDRCSPAPSSRRSRKPTEPPCSPAMSVNRGNSIRVARRRCRDCQRRQGATASLGSGSVKFAPVSLDRHRPSGQRYRPSIVSLFQEHTKRRGMRPRRFRRGRSGTLPTHLYSAAVSSPIEILG